jgi:hypothetical protein
MWLLQLQRGDNGSDIVVCCGCDCCSCCCGGGGDGRYYTLALLPFVSSSHLHSSFVHFERYLSLANVLASSVHAPQLVTSQTC